MTNPKGESLFACNFCDGVAWKNVPFTGPGACAVDPSEGAVVLSVGVAGEAEGIGGPREGTEPPTAMAFAADWPAVGLSRGSSL